MARSFAGPKAGDRLGIHNETLIAATPAEMRAILDNLTNKAVSGKIPADAFALGINELSEAAKSPNYIGRNIRNTMAHPLARTLVDNPDMAEGMANTMVPQLEQFGFNTQAMRGMIGPGMDILKQAKEDGLLKPDVSDELVAEKLQRPLHSAYVKYIRDNRYNPKINKLIRTFSPGVAGEGSALEIYGGAQELGIEPEYFTDPDKEYLIPLK